MKNPCYNTTTKTDCPKRDAGCAIDCPEWAKYVADRNTNYEKRYDDRDVDAVIADRYVRLSKRGKNRRKY